MRINTERENSFVLLFIKPINGICTEPKALKIKGNTAEFEIPVGLRDVPNFFVEAMTISGGQIFSEVREIVVPPQKRILNVDVQPESNDYKPNEKAKAKLIVTDLNGKPVVGQIAVAVYDKSVEYISGGSNVPDIKEFFWKWQRWHNAEYSSNLEYYQFNIFGEFGKPRMHELGRNALIVNEFAIDNVNRENDRDVLLEGMYGVANSRVFSSRMRVANGTVKLEPAEIAHDINGKAVMDSVALPAPTESSTVGEYVEPAVRKNFSDTAFWSGVVVTDADGVAPIELTMPESLTTWKINVWAMSHGTRVGYGSSQIITRKDLILRMQTPRFLVEKDQVMLTANVHNYLKTEKEVLVELELDELISSDKKNNSKKIKIAPNAEGQVDWLVDASGVGDAKIRMFAKTDEESDAMEKVLPIYVHGIAKQEAWSGFIASDKNAGTLEFSVPKERKPEQSKLTVRYSPTLAGTLIDAIPYLVDYPYGCTEQTLNRFLPTVLVQKALIDMNIDLAKLEQAHTNLNAQELGNNNNKRSWTRDVNKRTKNPVYSVDEIRLMSIDGVKKLSQMQNADGGWGWFSGWQERSSAHLTALIVRGLYIAQRNDVQVDPQVIERGRRWLSNYQSQQTEHLKNYLSNEAAQKPKDKKPTKQYADAVDAFVMFVLAETAETQASDANNDANDDANNNNNARTNRRGTRVKKSDANTNAKIVDRKSLFVKFCPAALEMREFLWRDRGKLSQYGVALLGLSEASFIGEKSRAQDCRKIVEQYLVRDKENQTAYLNLRRNAYWCWWNWDGSEFETQAYYLRLLMAVEPGSDAAPQLVKYLLNNRRNAVYWNSTRDTAICVEAFVEYLRKTGEEKPDMTVEVYLDNEIKKTIKITSENLFQIDNTLVLEGDAVTTGKHKIEIKKRGKGVLYFNAYLENFTLEDFIGCAGLEVKVERRLYLLKRDESAASIDLGSRGQVVEQHVEKY
ncbi:MAG: alpha-2-macroglobulin, partial [Planctomycetaceae bacterium]|nr:alpha-2-macroglobulin [Planctomycetaceae bacterium]